MKRLFFFLLFLIGLSQPSRLWADDEDYNTNRIAPGSKGEPLEIQVWADRDNEETYYEGENITLYFKANRDAYVALYNIDARGQVFLLYPQNPGDPHFIRGGVTYQLPDRLDNYDLWVTGPQGVEFVQAVASLRPFDLPDNWPSYYRGSRAPSRSYSSPVKVDGENIEEFIYELNSRLIPIKEYPDECAEDLYTFYVAHRPQTVYRPVVYDYGYWDFDYPYGSEIWIDGVYCGIAPLYSWSLYPGTHIVRVIQPGYPPYIRQIYCYPRSRFSLNFSFFFDFGYRNNRYYRDYYPYSYFCYISPDYRYKYRHQYYGESRYKDVFRKDVRFKTWVSRDKDDRDWGKSKLLGSTVREKLRRDDGKVAVDRRETKKRSTIREVLERNRDGDGEKVRTRESKKSGSVYEAWEKSRKGRVENSEGSRNDGDAQTKEKVRYRNWEEGKKEGRSKNWDGGGQPTPSYDAGKRQEHHPAPAVKESPPRSKPDNGGGKQDRSKKGPS